VRTGDNLVKGWTALLIAAALAPALASAQVSLSTVVDLAQRNSSAIKLAEADVQKANAALEETRDVYIPSLEAGSSIGMRSIGFPAGQPSVLSLSMQAQVLSFAQWQYIRAARTGVQSASLRLKDAREQVALDASTIYLELDTAGLELDAAHQQETLATRLVEIEQERAEAGVDPLSESLQARLTAAQIKLKRLHLEAHAAALAKELAALTGLPPGTITPDHASIPEIPEMRENLPVSTTPGIDSAGLAARSKQLQAHGDALSRNFPIITFGAQYNRDSSVFADYLRYYLNNPPPNNLSAGFSIQIPLFDLNRRAKAKESAAEALRATVEAEQAQRQNEVQIASLTGSLRELDTLAEIASLKQQIANEQLQAVLAQLELGNGASAGPGAPAQLSPKAEQLARIDERQKFEDALDAGFELSKARLSLLRALGHMEDWLQELHAK
jgi:outer membrane protein TolC